MKKHFTILVCTIAFGMISMRTHAQSIETQLRAQGIYQQTIDDELAALRMQEITIQKALAQLKQQKKSMMEKLALQKQIAHYNRRLSQLKRSRARLLSRQAEQ